MLQKTDLARLQGLNTKELDTLKAQLETKKKQLEVIKDSGSSGWTATMQKQYVNTDELLAEVNDCILQKETKQVIKETVVYEPKKGSLKCVHLELVQGRRFNPATGKEESKPVIQLFSYPEWALFKNNYVKLGYTILRVLHDPYGEAEQYVTKDK